MTFREKLQKEHPTCTGARWWGGCMGCPKDYGYEDHRPSECDINSASCSRCWARTIPGTEEPSIKPDLNALIERAGTKKDISLLIHINGDDTTISVYPCPDPSEKKGNPVAEAYKLLVGSPHSAEAFENAIKKLEEALEC